MQTQLSSEFEASRDGKEAQAILRKCVHCGFCNATCPTYQLLGDELDGPRGRIYLIKQVLEGAAVTRSTQQHLDRCLTCLNCQTTCPSGVEYGHLVEIGRKIVDARVQRPAAERTVRWLLKEGLTSRLFAPAMRLGQALRPLLPAALQKYSTAACGSRIGGAAPGAGASAGVDAARLCAALHDAHHRCCCHRGCSLRRELGSCIRGLPAAAVLCVRISAIMRGALRTCAAISTPGCPSSRRAKWRRSSRRPPPAASQSRNMDTRLPATRTMRKRRRASARWLGT